MNRHTTEIVLTAIESEPYCIGIATHKMVSARYVCRYRRFQHDERVEKYEAILHIPLKKLIAVRGVVNPSKKMPIELSGKHDCFPDSSIVLMKTKVFHAMPVIQLEYCQVCDTELCNDDPAQICKECVDNSSAGATVDTSAAVQ